jgi:hypothetical protein
MDNGVVTTSTLTSSKGGRTDTSSWQFVYTDSTSGLNEAQLSVTKAQNDENCVDFKWQRLRKRSVDTTVQLQDCIDLDTSFVSEGEASSEQSNASSSAYADDHKREESWWYGGGETFNSVYASSSIHNQSSESIRMQPFLSSDIYAVRDAVGGVLQAVWLNSNGWSVRVHDTEVASPQWVSFGKMNEFRGRRMLCVRTDWTGFVAEEGNTAGNGRAHGASLLPLPLTQLQYTVCRDDNLLTSWQRRVRDSIKSYEKRSPSSHMIEDPIWSTWAEFKKGRFYVLM